MIEYYVEKGIYKYNVMFKADKQKSFVCSCNFKENAEKIATILNDDIGCFDNEKPMIYRTLEEAIDSV